MTPANRLIFVGICGAIAGLCVGIAVHDWNMSAHAGERDRCRDGTDTRAYMSRLPGESHSAERCVLMLRFGSKEWVPELGAVTMTGAGVRGKPGLEQQLGYVRAECRRLARQLKQKC